MSLRRLLCRHFHLVFREDHDYIYSKWIQFSERMRADNCRLERIMQDTLAAHSTVVTDLQRERDLSRQLTLRVCINDIAPIEAMNRALEVLKPLLRNSDLILPSTNEYRQVGQAVDELENGLTALSKNKKIGANNGSNSRAA